MIKSSLDTETAKLLIQSTRTRGDSAIIALACLGKPSKVIEVRAKLLEIGEPAAKRWNLSAVLDGVSGRAAKTTDGWELTAKGRTEIATLAQPHQSKSGLKDITEPLRSLLPSIANTEVKAFIQEAISCIDHRLLKAGVVFTWVGAIAVLQNHVVKFHLAAMNADIQAIDANWRPAKNADGLGMMKEATFLDSLVRIGVIGKNVKTELKACLDLRNGCGHPNSLKIGEAKVVAHVETLVLNVFQQF